MFAEKVVVISGASRGIGKAIAEAFAQQRAKLALIARQRERLIEVEQTLRETGCEVMPVVADVTRSEEVKQAVREILEHYGQIDVLVNNAGMALRKPFVEMNATDLQTIMATNLQSVYNMTQAFLPAMLERRAGTIINMAAAIAHKGYPGLAVYSAAKAAVIAFGASLAKEVRREGVQVYTICPHAVDTDLYHSLFGSADADKLLAPAQVAYEVLQVALGQRGLASGQELDITLTASLA